MRMHFVNKRSTVLQALKTNTYMRMHFANKMSTVLQALKTNTFVRMHYTNKGSIGSWIIPGVLSTSGKSFMYMITMFNTMDLHTIVTNLEKFWLYIAEILSLSDKG